jgi:hypothetical protein
VWRWGREREEEGTRKETEWGEVGEGEMEEEAERRMNLGGAATGRWVGWGSVRWKMSWFETMDGNGIRGVAYLEEEGLG